MRAMYMKIDKINTYWCVHSVSHSLSARRYDVLASFSPDEFFIDLLFERRQKKVGIDVKTNKMKIW